MVSEAQKWEIFGNHWRADCIVSHEARSDDLRREGGEAGEKSPRTKHQGREWRPVSVWVTGSRDSGHVGRYVAERSRKMRMVNAVWQHNFAGDLARAVAGQRVGDRGLSVGSGGKQRRWRLPQGTGVSRWPGGSDSASERAFLTVCMVCVPGHLPEFLGVI